MFDRLKRRFAGQKEVQLPATVGDSKGQFFEAFGSPWVKLARREVADILHWIVTILLVLVILRMSPRTVVPMMVTAGALPGETHVVETSSGAFVPTPLNVDYEARRFARELLTINPEELTPNIAHVTRSVRDKAVKDLDDFLAKENPSGKLASDKNYTRDAEPVSTNTLTGDGGDLIIVRVRTTETDSSGGKPRKRIRVVSITYSMLPVTDIQKAEQTNDIGWTPTHFSVSDEADKESAQ